MKRIWSHGQMMLSGRVMLGAALALVLLLPLNLLANRPFHHDEALYATWALEMVSGRDPWLIRTPVDKPPLFIYTLAGVMALLDASETTARLPSLGATGFIVGLTFGLGRRLYGAAVGLAAAWLAALSPFILLFAPTAFTDPLMTALVLAGCLAAASNRPAWAGAALGLAIAAKQQAIFFGPLILALAMGHGQFAMNKSPHIHHPRLLSSLRPFFTALVVSLLPLLAWDFARMNSAEFLERSLANYGGLSGDVASFGRRWWGFVELLWYGTGSPILNGIFLVGLPLLLAYGVWERRGKRWPARPSSGFPPVATDLILILFISFFLLGHAVLSFQVWDRYLLGLIPLLALLLARVLLLPWTFISAFWLERWPVWRQPAARLPGLAVAALLAITLARPVQDAVNGRYPLGSNSLALQGIDQVVAYLQGNAGANNTLYHRWLGAHWRFYLWGYPYDLKYWATPGDLAAQARPGHLIAFPSWRSDTETRLALARAGLTLRELTRAYHQAGYPSIVLYRIDVGPVSP